MRHPRHPSIHMTLFRQLGGHCEKVGDWNRTTGPREGPSLSTRRVSRCPCIRLGYSLPPAVSGQPSSHVSGVYRPWVRWRGTSFIHKRATRHRTVALQNNVTCPRQQRRRVGDKRLLYVPGVTGLAKADTLGAPGPPKKVVRWAG